VTEHQKAVLDSFEIIKSRLPEVTELLYHKLFELEPNIRHIFPGDMTKQKEKLSHMLIYMVENIDRYKELESTLPELGTFHRSRGIDNKNFTVFRDALLYALRLVMKEQFTAKVEEAWKSAYHFFYTVMTNTTVIE
jgi:hemoglobin-like flavoprotein